MKTSFVAVVILFCIESLALAHGGGTDRCGGHNDRKRGGYHIHNHIKYCNCYPDAPGCAKEKPKRKEDAGQPESIEEDKEKNQESKQND